MKDLATWTTCWKTSRLEATRGSILPSLLLVASGALLAWHWQRDGYPWSGVVLKPTASSAAPVSSPPVPAPESAAAAAPVPVEPTANPAPPEAQPASSQVAPPPAAGTAASAAPDNPSAAAKPADQTSQPIAAKADDEASQPIDSSDSSEAARENAGRCFSTDERARDCGTDAKGNADCERLDRGEIS